ncbi:phage tail protein [Maridesulfovibrio sp.]|uniref:phage tail-collar fiber domain-containing protein n=1 Tax=Maridesulfovibrio sp. TaxID=2795000 RepID=UPI0029CA836F|nr:phage tail protein [Maridesulfovibrio sp.]
MSSIITLPGENLIAAKQGAGQILVIDKMIFANVPGVDPEADIDRSTQKPAADQIVLEYDIPAEYKKYVNPNQVVYSAVLDSNAGNFDFNWIGLYSAADDVVVAITTLPTISKFKTAGQIQGNHLTRNFMMAYEGAAQSTGMSVAADTWQLDFSTRLAGLDERDRMTNRDIYGRARFWCDGFELVNTEGSYFLSSGVGYVEGIRIDLDNPLPIPGENLPKSVWLDVSLTPQGSTVVAKAEPVYGDSFEDNVQDGIKHYYVKIGEIDGTGKVSDFRTVDEIKADLVEYLKHLIEIHKTDPDAHMELLARLATGIPEIIFPEKNAVDVGETPVFTWGKFVPIFINTSLNAVQVQVDHASKDFLTPLFDSGPDSVAAVQNRFAMPAGYLLVSNMYKVRVRWRLNTGQWSPWSVAVVFTTKAEFNYVARPEMLAPADGVTGVQERPELEAGAFAVVGDTEDTHYSTQFMVKVGDAELHKSPEVLGGFKYQLPAGLLQPGNTYDAYCKETGKVLGESEWSYSSSFNTAAAFIEGDAAILLVAWAIVVKATATGTALEDLAELYSNGTEQEAGEGDWAEYVVNAKVNDAGLNVLDDSTNSTLIVDDVLTNRIPILTELGQVAGDVTPWPIPAANQIPDMAQSNNGCSITTDTTYYCEGSPVFVGCEDLKSSPYGWFCDVSANLFVTFDQEISVKSYQVLCHAKTYATYMARSWRLYYSRNGLTWISMDQQSGLAQWATGELRSFELAEVVTAKYFKMALFETSTQAYTGLSGLKLMSPEKTGTAIDISAAGFTKAPTRAHLIPKLMAATGPAGATFTAADFQEIPVEEVTLGTDTDPDIPNYLHLKSARQTPAPFRTIAMGLKGMAAGSKSLIETARIDTWKLGA